MLHLWHGGGKTDKKTSMKKRIDTVLTKLNLALNRFPEDARKVIETVVLSLVAGTAAVFFLKAIDLFRELTYGALAESSPTAFFWGSLAVIGSSSFIVCLLLKKVPEAAGSGIPQLKVAYWKEMGYVALRPVLIKFLAGMISLGGGASLGREGPTVYLCGGLSSVASGYLGRPKRGRRNALTVGAASGLAAAFNTPLAAITFVLEELVGDLSNRYLGSVVLASVMGALVVQASLGPQPAFSLTVLGDTSWQLYLLVPLIAFLATAGGIVFEKTALYLRGRLASQRRVSRWILPFWGGMLTWCIGISVFFMTAKTGIFGLGYGDLSDALAHGIPWRLAALLTIGKILATIVSYAFGGCGGIFSPTLFIGGMTGFFVAGLAADWLPLTATDHVVLAGVGMCTCLCSVIRAPLTSMLIVFEMTHEFAMVPALMIGVIVCEAMTRLFGNQNFYTSLLLQDGHELVKIHPPRNLQAWQAIEAGHLMSRKIVAFDSVAMNDANRILQGCPYRCFPVLDNGMLAGVVSREEVRNFVKTGHAPHIDPAVTCHPDEIIRDLSDRFILSPAGFLIVTERQTGRVLGILTLHDLLRAQAAVLEEQ